MTITTYAELQTAIGNWLDRTDLTDRAPEFIALAEAGINRDVDHWRGEKRATATIDARFSAVPTDYLRPIRFQISATERPLEPISVQDMHQRRAFDDNASGIPAYYAVVGGEFEFFPSPNSSYTGTLYYRAKVPALSNANTSNWVLANAPDVYLYGSLVHSAPFLVEDERVAMWGALYSQAVQRFNADGDDGRFGGAGKRKRIRR